MYRTSFKKNPDYNFYVSVYAGKGQKVKIYAAVNMTERMRQQFNFSRSGNAVSLSSAHNDYRDVIEEFVPGSAGKQEMLENCNGGCIPMTGQFVIEVPIHFLSSSRKKVSVYSS